MSIRIWKTIVHTCIYRYNFVILDDWMIGYYTVVIVSRKLIKFNDFEKIIFCSSIWTSRNLQK